jgi:restriction system protein
MTLWVVRAGRHGENEAMALDRGVVTIGWVLLPDLSSASSKEAVDVLVRDKHPDEKPGTLVQWTGQVWAFLSKIAIGDLVALPLKSRAAVAIGRVTGPYTYLADASVDARHARAVEWLRTDIPRSDFDQDILYSLGSTLTVFRVSRNNAEARVKAMLEGKVLPAPVEAPTDEAGDTAPLLPPDLQQYASDQVMDFITHAFKGHALARLVGEILVAQGYKVEVSSPGPDGGVDIIAGTGPMGFDSPRLAVQVKSGASPVDVSVLRELQGVMPRFGATHGLIVSWGGFKDSVIREARQLYFQIRLWDAGDLVTALQESYEKLSAELQAELPLKRVWVLVEEEE